MEKDEFHCPCCRRDDQLVSIVALRVEFDSLTTAAMIAFSIFALGQVLKIGTFSASIFALIFALPTCVRSIKKSSCARCRTDFHHQK